MSKQTVLLTGATGFLGSHLLDALIQQGYSVVVLKRSTSNLWRIEHLARKYKSYDVDIQTTSEIFGLEKIDVVIHLATDYGKGKEGFADIVEANVLLGVNLLDNCIKHGIQLFVNTDSFFNDSRYASNYMQNYTLSKRQFLDWLHVAKSSLSIVNMKLHHVYGPCDGHEKFIPWLFEQLLTKKSVDLSSGMQFRDFIYIEDVVSAYISIIESHENDLKGFAEYTVSTGEKTRLRDFCIKVKEVMELQTKTAVAKLNFGKKAFEGEIYDVFNDNSDLLALDWKPEFTLDKGIQEFVKVNLNKY